jgi:UDP-N-acetylglucosamine 1-carboxyvinyltransferase
MNYINELTKMGANAVICDPHRAIITGPTPLYGKDINSFDLRAGATMIIAALLAQGQSTLSGIEQVDRGYEAIEERLQKLGADIRREKI